MKRKKLHTLYRLIPALCFLTVVVCLGHSVAFGQNQCVIDEIPIPDPAQGVVRKGLAIDIFDRIWFTELERNKIGYYDQDSGEVTLVTLPRAGRGPHSIVTDSKGVAWFSEEEGNGIGMYDPFSRMYQEYPLMPNHGPYGITVDAYDNIWWTEMDGRSVGILSPSTGEIFEYPVDADATNLAIDLNTGTVWVTALLASRVIALDPDSGDVRRFNTPTPLSAPHSVDIDPEGIAWFTESAGNKIGRIDPDTGRVREFNVPTFLSVPHGITVGPDDSIWFVELTGNKIGHLDPSTGRITETAVPTASSAPYFLRFDSQGVLWFAEGDAPKLGLLTCF